MAEPKRPTPESLVAYRLLEVALHELIKLKPARDTPEWSLLIGFGELLEHYEQYYWPIGAPTSEQAAVFRREQEGGG